MFDQRKQQVTIEGRVRDDRLSVAVVVAIKRVMSRADVGLVSAMKFECLQMADKVAAASTRLRERLDAYRT